MMQTSVLDNHFQTHSYFLYSWGLKRGENGLWVQSWDRWERKTRYWCGFDIWNVALEAFRMQRGKSAKTKTLLEASVYLFLLKITTSYSQVQPIFSS